MTPTVQFPSTPAADRVSAAERWCRASGIAGSLLIFFAGAFAPGPPTHGGTDAAVLEHFRRYYEGTMQGMFVFSLGLMALLLFTAAVVRAAERAWRRAGEEPGVLRHFTLLAATAAVGMLLAAQAAAGAAAVIGHHATDAATARALDEIGHILAHLSAVPLGLFTLALALTVADARLAPRWAAALGALAALAMAATGCWVFLGGDTLHNVGGLSWPASMLWWLAISGRLVWVDRQPRAIAAIAPAVAAG